MNEAYPNEIRPSYQPEKYWYPSVCPCCGRHLRKCPGCGEPYPERHWYEEPNPFHKYYEQPYPTKYDNDHWTTCNRGSILSNTGMLFNSNV